ATATCVLMVNAIPIFVDVLPETGNLNPDLLEAAITPATRAIIVVHLFGLPADMEPIRAIAQRHGLRLIEDCAQAHGALYQGKPVGGLADVGAFSLNGTKVLAGPEGGLLTTADEAIFNQAGKVRVFGAQWKEGQRVIGDTDCLGYNYRMTEFVAAFTMARLRSFDREQATRVENARRLIDGIRDLEGVFSPPDVPSDRTHIYQMVHIRLEPDR